MKTVKILSMLLMSSLVLFSCKNEENPITDVEKSNNLALHEASSETILTEDYLYVIANTGLSLREYNNLQSNKLAIMPYGTKVKVVFSEKNPTMTVGGIKGGMNEIDFNQKKGFAFNGYLSKYFPPEKNISAKGYAEELKTNFNQVSFSEKITGTASKPINIETLILPEASWHETFYIAQKLYQFPLEFVFPHPTGKDHQVIKDSKPKKDVWVSELQINRDTQGVLKIEYVYKTTKGFSKSITLTKENNAMKVEKIEKVE